MESTQELNEYGHVQYVEVYLVEAEDQVGL